MIATSDVAVLDAVQSWWRRDQTRSRLRGSASAGRGLVHSAEYRECS